MLDMKHVNAIKHDLQMKHLSLSPLPSLHIIKDSNDCKLIVVCATLFFSLLASDVSLFFHCLPLLLLFCRMKNYFPEWKQQKKASRRDESHNNNDSKEDGKTFSFTRFSKQ